MVTLSSELVAHAALVRRLGEPWPAEERSARWVQSQPATRALRLLSRFPHTSAPPPGAPDRITLTSATSRYDAVQHPIRPAIGVSSRALAAGGQAVADEVGAQLQSRGDSILRDTRTRAGRQRRMMSAVAQPRNTYDPRSAVATWGGIELRGMVEGAFIAHGQDEAMSAVRERARERAEFHRHSWMPSIARVGAVVLRFASARSRRLDRFTLGDLAARYCGTPYNRHDARRWMRAFRWRVLVASDALEAGQRTQAIEVLCGMVGLEDAVGLTQEPRGIADYVAMEVERIGTFREGLGVPIDQSHRWPPPLDGVREAALALPGVERVAVTSEQRLVRVAYSGSATLEQVLERVEAVVVAGVQVVVERAVVGGWRDPWERLDPSRATGADLEQIAALTMPPNRMERAVPPLDLMYPVLTATGTRLDEVATTLGLRRSRDPNGIHPETDVDLRLRIASVMFNVSVSEIVVDQLGMRIRYDRV